MSRIGTVGYLNAKPLTRHIPRDTYDVVEGHPSVISELLTTRDIELGLVPVVTVDTLLSSLRKALEAGEASPVLLRATASRALAAAAAMPPDPVSEPPELWRSSWPAPLELR